MSDTDEEEKPPSLVVIESDNYLDHLAAHISATRHHLAGAPEPPEPPYPPSFHPPTGYWTSAEKALFFRALGAHSRLRPDLIAASIGTKSTADVAVYLSLLREGAIRADSNNKASSRTSHGPTITIGRDQHTAAHEVSAELVTLEDEQAARICVEEPMHAKEVESEARAEVLRTVKNGMRVRRGEGGGSHGRDREGQRARKEEFGRWRVEHEIEWAREDVLAGLDATRLQVLDRILRLDEEKRADADSGDDGEVVDRAQQRSSTTLHPVASSSSPGGELYAETPPRSSRPATPTPDDDAEDDEGAILSKFSPASRRVIYKRLHMRRKRAEASGGVAQLDTARLKPGRKVSATSKFRQPKPLDDGHSASDDKNPNPKQPMRGDTRPYRIQRELERLGIGADYLRANGMGLFHLGALGRLMRLYPRLDSSRPEGVAESIAKETIETLHTLVVQFTRDLVQRAITLRELDFALRAHTKVWRLGERLVHPLHVRRALELCGGARLSMRMHFERLLGRFSEDEESTDDDVPLAVRARMRQAKAIACDEDEGDDADEGNGRRDIGQQQRRRQQANPSKDTQAHGAGLQRWTSSHRAIYSPFVYAPDMVASAHPFGVYAPGTMPDQPGRPAHPRHVTNQDDDHEEEEEDLMPAETDEEALEVELNAEARLDTADARADAVYEAGVLRELRGAHDDGVPLRRLHKRRRAGGEEADAVDGDGVFPMRLRTRKRRKNAGGGEWFPVVEGGEMLKSPDGVKVKSAAMIEDSDSDSDYLQ